MRLSTSEHMQNVWYFYCPVHTNTRFYFQLLHNFLADFFSCAVHLLCTRNTKKLISQIVEIPRNSYVKSKYQSTPTQLLCFTFSFIILSISYSIQFTIFLSPFFPTLHFCILSMNILGSQAFVLIRQQSQFNWTSTQLLLNVKKFQDFFFAFTVCCRHHYSNENET